MNWKPVSPEELARIIDRELAVCPGELRAYFQSVAFEPTKWSQAPHGNAGGGFWAIAVDQNRVLWYHDIEDGFNVSVFAVWGTIPAEEYWCNQDELIVALPALMGRPTLKAGPPEPLRH